MIRLVLPPEVPAEARERQLHRAEARLNRDMRRKAEAVRTGDMGRFRNALRRIKRDADMVAAWRSVQHPGCAA